MFFNKYPYTDFHELNLDWLLTTYQQIVDDIAEIQGWISKHEIDYAEAIRRLTAVENEIDTFEQRINTQFANLSAEIREQLEEQQKTVEKLLADTQAEIDAIILDFTNQMEAIKAELINTINQIRAEVAKTIDELRYILDANNQYMMDWVEIRLQQFIDSLPEILTVQVYNPYRGQVTDIQTAINDLYDLARIWGLTAAEYDSLQLTAAEYDALGLTAVRYDTLGYRLLFKDPAHYMLSPFTGLYVKIRDVVMDLAALHMNALTAAAYDALDLDADTYDMKDLAAYDYDWNGAALLP